MCLLPNPASICYLQKTKMAYAKGDKHWYNFHNLIQNFAEEM